jgi:hypothetical protein
MSGFKQQTMWLAVVLAACVAATTGVAGAAVVADSVADFSGVQGQDNWSYGYYDINATSEPGTLQEFPTAGALPRFGWTGNSWDYLGGDGLAENPPWTELGADFWHPNGANNVPGEQWVVRRWDAALDGDLQANLTMFQFGVDGTPEGSVGRSVNARVYVNGQLRYVHNIRGGVPQTTNSVALPDIVTGDAIDFVIDPAGVDWNDGTTMSIVIDDQMQVDPMLPVAFSMGEFSGVQGQDNWFYGYHDVTANGDYEATPGGPDDLIEMPTWNDGGFWDIDGDAGVAPWTLLNAQGGHPNGANQTDVNWAVRRWVSEVDGEVEIDWTLAKENLGCGNGVSGLVFVNGEEVDSATVAFDDAIGVERQLRVSVHEGDFIDIALTPFGTDDSGDGGFDNDSCDGSILSAVINKVESTLLLGDVNLDGEVNGLDVDPFVEVLLQGPYQTNADMNEDGVVNGLDVDPFVAAVVGGGGTQAVPEPTSLLLCLLGLVGLLSYRRTVGRR